MSQPLPVIRQIYWPQRIPQLIAILLLAGLVRLFFPMATVVELLVAGVVIYFFVSRFFRAALLGEHTKGMALYRAGRFEEAISHFQANYEFFSKHRKIDAWRSLLFGVASRNPFRVISLGNMVYCHGQLGNGAKAIELYEEVLREMPDHAVAIASLKMLNAMAPRPNTEADSNAPQNDSGRQVQSPTVDAEKNAPN